jgi:hypothetical protein
MAEVIKKTTGLLAETTDGQLYKNNFTNIKELTKEELISLCHSLHRHSQSLQDRIETLTGLMDGYKAKLDIIKKTIAL